jgi:hypothetical protein
MLGVPRKINLEPSRRKLLLIAAAAVLAVGLILIGVLTGSSSDRPPAAAGTNLMPHAQLGQAPESDSFAQAYQGRLEHMIREQMQSFRAELDSRARAREARDDAQIERLVRMVNQSPARTAAGAPESAVRTVAGPLDPPRYVVLRDSRSADRLSLATVGGSPFAAGLASPGLASAGLPPANALSTDMPLPGMPSPGDMPSSVALAQTGSDPFVLPQDGWAEGRLINGVVTTQGGEFRYAQIKLHGLYHSANGYEHNIDGCVVLGESSADIAAGRINIKPIKLTCTLPNSRTKTWQTAGYVVDSRDGIQGIVATLVNSGESKLAAASAAGLIQGGGAFYAQRSLTNTFSPTTGSAASILTGNPTNALIGGAVGSAGGALGQEVQNYYSAFRPTVQTGGGVDVVVFITTPMSLPVGGEAISTVRAAR